MLSFLDVYSHHSILECYNLFSGVKLSMRSFFVIIETNHGRYSDLIGKHYRVVKDIMYDSVPD